LKISLKRRRVAVSELVGTLIMVAITLTAGAAVFGWINGQASSSEGAYGASVANNINFLKERFVVVSQSFGEWPSGACTGTPKECTMMSFWIYNSGQVAFTLASLNIYSQSAPLDITFYTGSGSACSASSQNCGFIVYSTVTGAQVCSDIGAWQGIVSGDQPGFYLNTSPSPSLPTTLGQGVLSPSPYQVAMPTAATCSAGAQYLIDGATYTLTFTGLYGNTVSTSVTVNG
jgi:flagellin-like protein